MNLKQTTLAASMMAVFVASSANAAVFIGKAAGQETKPVVLAIEQPFETNGVVAKSGNDLGIILPSIGGYTTSSSISPMFYKITLKGGVTFHRTPTLLCMTTGVTTTAAVITNGGVAGSNSVTFSVKSGLKIKAGASAACQLHVGSTVAATAGMGANSSYYRISEKTDKSISVVLEYKAGFNSASLTYTGTFITFKPKWTVVASLKGMNNTAAAAQIDVKEASKKFTTTVGSGPTVALLGQVKYSATIPTPRAKTASFPVALTDVISTGFVTVAGPVNGAANLSLATVNCAGLTSPTPTGGSVTFNLTSSSAVTLANLVSGINVCMTLNGNNAIDAGQFTVTVDGKAKSGYAPVFAPAQNIYNLTKNGTTFRVLNIASPLAAGQTGDTSVVRLYNPNNTPTTVRGTMYAQDGTAIGTTQVLGAPLNPYEVRVLQAAQLATIFSATTWVGRARLIIDAETDNFEVLALTRSPSGVLVNMSGQTK